MSTPAPNGSDGGTATQLSRLALLFYGAPALPLAALTLPLYVILPSFYASAIGLPLAQVGAILLAVRLADALSDPLAGILCDRITLPSGRRRGWFLLGSFPAALAAWMILTTARRCGAALPARLGAGHCRSATRPRLSPIQPGELSSPTAIMNAAAWPVPVRAWCFWEPLSRSAFRPPRTPWEPQTSAARLCFSLPGSAFPCRCSLFWQCFACLSPLKARARCRACARVSPRFCAIAPFCACSPPS